jgi:hypothetical protein
MSERATSAGRRATTTGRRLDVVTLLAVLLPLLCAGAVALVHEQPSDQPAHAPSRTALTRATVICPPALSAGDRAGGDVAVGTAAPGVRGEVRVGLGADSRQVEVASGRVTTAAAGDGATVVTGEDDAAPGLLAARFGAGVPAALACPSPRPQAWFTGVGSGAAHTSVLVLVNPDAGTAVADVTVYGRNGVIDVPRLRGVSVPGRSSVEVDLADVVPRRDELTLQVATARGRIGASVLDRSGGVAGTRQVSDWLPAQPAPATEELLVGIAPGSGRRLLAVANPSQRQVRVQVRLVTGNAVVTTQDLEPLRVDPGSTARLDLTKALRADAAEGTTGLLVTGTGPVTATLRSYAGGDLSHTVPGQPVARPTTVLLPGGGGSTRVTVEIAGATRAGVVRVVARDADGGQLAARRVEVTPGRGITVPVPARAASVTVSPQRAAVQGAVLIAGDDGAAVLPLAEPVLSGLVPDVRPGLP